MVVTGRKAAPFRALAGWNWCKSAGFYTRIAQGMPYTCKGRDRGCNPFQRSNRWITDTHQSPLEGVEMKMLKSDLVPGFQYERLTLIELVSHQQRRQWRCLCTCGNEVIARPKDLLLGSYRSCGCFRRTQWLTHGMSYSHEYGCWQAMIARCENANTKKFKDYGGRGINVCHEWRSDFAALFKDMGPCQKHESLDRKDPNKGYEPNNCRWATLEVQANNRRTTVRYEGKTVREWSNALGVPYEAMKKRLRRYGSPTTMAAVIQPV